MYSNIVCISLSIGIVIILGYGIIYTRNYEKKIWNKGKCPYCGKRWFQYDTDSQGGRMYRCENWHHCDITYNIDKK